MLPAAERAEDGSGTVSRVTDGRTGPRSGPYHARGRRAPAREARRVKLRGAVAGVSPWILLVVVLLTAALAARRWRAPSPPVCRTWSTC